MLKALYDKHSTISTEKSKKDEEIESEEENEFDNSEIYAKKIPKRKRSNADKESKVQASEPKPKKSKAKASTKKKIVESSSEDDEPLGASKSKSNKSSTKLAIKQPKAIPGYVPTKVIYNDNFSEAKKHPEFGTLMMNMHSGKVSIIDNISRPLLDDIGKASRKSKDKNDKKNFNGHACPKGYCKEYFHGPPLTLNECYEEAVHMYPPRKR
jgi:hypothetical protein